MNPTNITGCAAKTTLLSLALVVASIAINAVPAHAKKSCGVYKVTIGSKTFTGDQTVMVPPTNVNGKIAHIQGNFTDFFLDLNTWKVTNYQLTKTATTLFANKTPSFSGTLSSPLFLKLNNEQIVLQRSGTNSDVKIQAKDCDNGGTFQMENEDPAQQVNQLANGVNYCLQDSVSGKLFFTNGPVLGYDSPQLATVNSWASDNASWSLDAGGRIGMVTGEDAETALAGTGNASACGR